MNERWRVVLAGLVAALAIPFLIVDSPAPAEGVETTSEEPAQEVAASGIQPEAAEVEVDGAVEVPANAVEIIVTTAEVSPDIARLADQAGTWGLARAQAIDDGRVDATFTPPPSKTDYSLLPVVNTEPEVVEPDEDVTPDQPPAEDVDDPGDNATNEPVDGDLDPGPEDGPAGEDDPDEPEPTEPEETTPTPDVVVGPAAPPQVDGRVPPPSGGPTAAQWNALRKCESTHNYAAISPSGLYRGAYQFSQQTWDWVAGIHWPHLVGVDPIDAEPAWQDVMAYTLYAMRGWDQWPICGKNLL